jgi:carbon monoxide dehydrogenase subunit G
MAWFGSGNDNNERYYPVPPPQVFAALVEVVPLNFRLKDSDDFTMNLNFSKGASAFTWGENFTAQVLPTEGGATVRVSGAGKVGGSSQQGSRIAKLTNQLFDDLTTKLRSQRT